MGTTTNTNVVIEKVLTSNYFTLYVQITKFPVQQGRYDWLSFYFYFSSRTFSRRGTHRRKQVEMTAAAEVRLWPLPAFVFSGVAETRNESFFPFALLLFLRLCVFSRRLLRLLSSFGAVPRKRKKEKTDKRRGEQKGKRGKIQQNENNE